MTVFFVKALSPTFTGGDNCLPSISYVGYNDYFLKVIFYFFSYFLMSLVHKKLLSMV